MSKKRYVDTSFWSDVWVVDELNALDRYLFLYLLTNEKTNIAGVYQISLRTVSYETGIEKEQILVMLKRMKSRVVYLNGWMVLRNAIKNQNYKNEKIRQGIELALDKSPYTLFPYLMLPNDWIPAVVKKNTDVLQIEIDDSYMTLEDSGKLNDSDSDSDSDTDTTNVVVAGNEKTIAKKPKVSSKDIDHVFDYWEETVGFRVTSDRKRQREFVSKLLKENDIDSVERMIQGVTLAMGDQFGPRIANFKQLYYKWDELKGWGRRTMSKQSGKGKVAKI